jgi:5'-3' exonuclease/20S proteasome alpha/beta subunit
MGVPKFYRWLSERYPKINQPLYCPPVSEPPDPNQLHLNNSDNDNVEDASAGFATSSDDSGVQTIQTPTKARYSVADGLYNTPMGGGVAQQSLPSNSSSDPPTQSSTLFDRVYLDMNGILHGCSHSNGAVAGGKDSETVMTEQEMLSYMCYYIDRIVEDIATPSQILYCAIDGVAPRAKMNQQRSRRYRSGKEQDIAAGLELLEVEETESSPGGKEGDDADAASLTKSVDGRFSGTMDMDLGSSSGEVEEHDAVPAEDDEVAAFHSNSITPGTKFLYDIAQGVQQHIERKMTENGGHPKWKHLEIIWSGPNVPGEGEHKIMQFMREEQQQNKSGTSKSEGNDSSSSKYHPNLRHCIVGQDGDLVMLALATHEPHICLLRERVLFGPERLAAEQKLKSSLVDGGGSGSNDDADFDVVDYSRSVSNNGDTDSDTERDTVDTTSIISLDGDIISGSGDIDVGILPTRMANNHEEDDNDASTSTTIHLDTGVRGMIRSYVTNTDFELLHINVLREYLSMEFETSNLFDTSVYDTHRTVDDFVFLTFLVGNDFLPPMPALDIGDHAFDLLFRHYKKHRQSWTVQQVTQQQQERAQQANANANGEDTTTTNTTTTPTQYPLLDPYLTESGRVLSYKRLEYFLRGLGRKEASFLEDKHAGEKELLEQIRKDNVKYGREGKTSGKDRSALLSELQLSQVQTLRKENYKHMIEQTMLAQQQQSQEEGQPRGGGYTRNNTSNNNNDYDRDGSGNGDTANTNGNGKPYFRPVTLSGRLPKQQTLRRSRMSSKNQQQQQMELQEGIFVEQEKKETENEQEEEDTTSTSTSTTFELYEDKKEEEQTKSPLLEQLWGLLRLSISSTSTNTTGSDGDVTDVKGVTSSDGSSETSGSVASGDAAPSIQSGSGAIASAVEQRQGQGGRPQQQASSSGLPGPARDGGGGGGRNGDAVPNNYNRGGTGSGRRNHQHRKGRDSGTGWRKAVDNTGSGSTGSGRAARGRSHSPSSMRSNSRDGGSGSGPPRSSSERHSRHRRGLNYNYRDRDNHTRDRDRDSSRNNQQVQANHNNHYEQHGNHNYSNQHDNAEDEDMMNDLKGRYYYDKFGFTPLDVESHLQLRKSYLEGLVWNLEYYYGGCISWDWFYPYHYGPMFSDLRDLDLLSQDLSFDVGGQGGKAAVQVQVQGAPLQPFEQLLACLPPSSSDLLTNPKHKYLLTSQESPLKEYYPLHFTVDMNGKRNPWEAVVLLPFINATKLTDTVRNLVPASDLTQEERLLNTHGHAFRMTRNSVTGTVEQTPLETAERFDVDFVDMNANAAGGAASQSLVGERPRFDSTMRMKQHADMNTEANMNADAKHPPMAGFSTLLDAPLEGLLVSARRTVNVHGMKSQYRSALLDMSNLKLPPLPPLPALANKLITGTNTVYINYPHLTEALVTGVSDAKGMFRGSMSGGDGAAFKLIPHVWSADEKQQWQVLQDALRRMYREGNGTLGSGGWILPDNDNNAATNNHVMLSVRPVARIEHNHNGNGSVKHYAPFEVQVPIAAALWNPMALNPAVVEAISSVSVVGAGAGTGGALHESSSLHVHDSDPYQYGNFDLEAIMGGTHAPKGLRYHIRYSKKMLDQEAAGQGKRKTKPLTSLLDYGNGNGHGNHRHHNGKRRHNHGNNGRKNNHNHNNNGLEYLPPHGSSSDQKRQLTADFSSASTSSLSSQMPASSSLSLLPNGSRSFSSTSQALFPIPIMHGHGYAAPSISMPMPLAIGRHAPQMGALVAQWGGGGSARRSGAIISLNDARTSRAGAGISTSHSMIKVAGRTATRRRATGAGAGAFVAVGVGAAVLSFSSSFAFAASESASSTMASLYAPTTATMGSMLVTGTTRRLPASIRGLFENESHCARRSSGVAALAFQDVLLEMRGGDGSSRDYNHGMSTDSSSTAASAPPLEFAHGTTTLSFKCKDGIVAAVDSRASIGPFVGSKTVQKVLPVTSHMLGTMAGGAADCSFWIRKLRSEARKYALEERGYVYTYENENDVDVSSTIISTPKEMSVARASKWLAQMLFSNRGLQLSVGTMIMGVDATSGDASIYYVDQDGSRIKGDMFAVGSGASFALGVLDTESTVESRLDMAQSEAITLAIKAIRHATFRDAYSGGYIGVYVITKEHGWQKVFSQDLATVQL